MNKINFTRVLLGGLVAGVVLNIGEFLLNEVVLGAQMKAYFAQLGLPPEPGTNFMVVAILLTFVLGVIIVWIYAAIRPRCGPGPKTAICVGLLAWFFVCLYCSLLYGMLLRIPTNVMLIGIVWCLVEYVLAAIAGAWLYKEE